MMMNHHADLIARAAGGDEASQRALYEAYHGRAARLAYLLLRDVLDAEEVVQDTFVYALKNLEAYDAERASLWTWLRVILVSRCRNKRRRRSLPRVSLDTLSRGGREPQDRRSRSDPTAAVAMREARRRMHEALAEVSPGARDALVLRYYEALPYAQIGEILGCSSEAARQRVVHGKSQLRELLARDDGTQVVEGGFVRRAGVR